MTKVIGPSVRNFLARIALPLVLAAVSGAQDVPSPPPPPHRGPAETLYFQLRSVGLDKTRVFHVREASLDRAAFHLTLEDGTIAFTEDVAGRVTGAFFEGDGEILLLPPNRVERASMELFTGAAILEERFASAYFRFNDDTFAQLQPALRPTDDAPDFIAEWNETAHNLAQGDALGLLTTLIDLPQSPGATPALPQDKIFHARVQGKKLGIFDLFYDSRAAEQVWVGQSKVEAGIPFFDVWSSYAYGQQEKSVLPENAVGASAASHDMEVSLYKIRAEIRMPTQLNAQATLELSVHSGGRRCLLFELSRFLQVHSVEANGKPVEFIHNQALEGTELARLGNDMVAVLFPEPVKSGDKIELRFDYGGEVLSEAGGGLVYVGARGSWYPNRRPEMSNFDLEFHYPAGWTLIATGRRTETKPAAGMEAPNADAYAGDQVSHWLTERPIPVAGFNLGQYVEAAARAGDIPVTTYAATGVEKTFPRAAIQLDSPQPLIPAHQRPSSEATVVVAPPPSPARNAQKVADSAARAVEFFSRNFGPYPYRDLALTQRPGAMSQGWPGVVFLSSFSFLTEEEKSQLSMDPVVRAMTTNVIAHEIAHQWWGDLITWGGYRDQWLVEALADYSALMLFETHDPEQFHKLLESYRDSLLLKNKDGRRVMEAGPVTLGNRLSCSAFPNGYEAISYGRGAWLFHMLRSMMRDATLKSARPDSSGADPFVAALRKVRERYQGREITTRELLSVFEEDLPRNLWFGGRKSLDWFYDDWIAGTAIPKFEVEDTKFTNSSAGVTVRGAIVRQDGPENLVTPVPIYASVGSQTIFLGQVFTEERRTPFHLSAPSGTRKVVVDPYHTLLTRAK